MTMPTYPSVKNTSITPNTSALVLAELADDPQSSVRERVASHPNASERVLEHLGGDVEPAVRAAVAFNPNTPLVLLAALTGDKYSQVRSCAISVLSIRWGVMGFIPGSPLEQ